MLNFREWGKPQAVKDLKISWYEPGDKEISLVQTFINKYLISEINKLEEFVSGKTTLSREELRRSLKIITSILSSHAVLPIWKEPAIQL